MINCKYCIFLPVIFVFIIFVTGCSGVSSPIEPGQAALNNYLNELPLICLTDANAASNAIGLLGAYELTVNENEISAELVSKRYSSIGESFIVNGISFFTIAPCSNCLKIESITLVAPYIEVTFSISHPFEKGDPFKPPTGRNRLDLDVFDLALVVAPVNTTSTVFSLTGASAYTEICCEADGYTTELAEVTGDTAAYPFFLVVDDSISGTSTFNKFKMGTKNVEFDTMFIGGYFELYLTMGYGASAVKVNRLNPTYYNPEFNRKAAWKVDVTPPEGEYPPAMGNTWDDTDDSTAYNVTVEVYDWQIGANVDSELTNTTDIYAASDVGSVSVEIPSMNSTLQSITTADSGSGMPDSPLVFTIPITNDNLLVAGEYMGLVKVTDERVPPSAPSPGETDALVDVPDGVSISYIGMPEFATYQTFTATVVLGIIPTIEITSPNGGESWMVGSRHDITWTTTDYTGDIKLEYSKDEFVADTNEIIASTEDDGIFDWLIPDDPSDTVRVRATLVGAPSFYDDSDLDFSIIEQMDEVIVYCRGSMIPEQIYSIDIEGIGPPEQWTNETGFNFVEVPKISPCGAHILYTLRPMMMAEEIKIIDVATGVITTITPSGHAAKYGDFSHDGTNIVAGVSAGAGGPCDLWTMDYDGGNAAVLPNGTGLNVNRPEYSVDDSEIYYTNSSSHEIMIYNVTTTGVTQFSGTGVWNDSPHGSIDGTQIAWATNYGNFCRWIYISPAGGPWNPWDKIIGFDQCVTTPCYSPDGTKMAVAHSGASIYEIAIYDLTDDTWTDITNNSVYDLDPDWGYIIPH
jgi:hypothetical protein